MKYLSLLALSVFWFVMPQLAHADDPAMIVFGLSGDCAGTKLKPDQYIQLDLYRGGIFSHDNHIPDESVAAYINQVLSTKVSPDHVPVLMVVRDDTPFGGVIRAAELARKSRAKMISMVPLQQWEFYFPNKRS